MRCSPCWSLLTALLQACKIAVVLMCKFSFLKIFSRLMPPSLTLQGARNEIWVLPFGYLCDMLYSSTFFLENQGKAWGQEKSRYCFMLVLPSWPRLQASGWPSTLALGSQPMNSWIRDVVTCTVMLRSLGYGSRVPLTTWRAPCSPCPWAALILLLSITVFSDFDCLDFP